MNSSTPPISCIELFKLYLRLRAKFLIFLKGINHEKDTKKCKSHLRANILVGPRMHKSFGNYSYMEAERRKRGDYKDMFEAKASPAAAAQSVQ